MGVWLQKKAEGIRMSLATKELRKILENKNRFERADIRVAAASYLAGMEDEQAIQLFLSPDEYPRSTLMAMYEQLESARNMLHNYVAKLNEKAKYDWGKGLDENVKAIAQNQSAGILALMVALSAYMREDGSQAARECWSKLQVGNEELSKALSLAMIGFDGSSGLLHALANNYLPPFLSYPV